MKNRIIIIDYNRASMDQLLSKLRAIGYRDLLTADTAHAAFNLLSEDPQVDLALIDMNMPDMEGISILDHIKNASPGTECIMVTAINEARTAVECLKKGAYDYLVKPVAKDVLAITLPKALERKRLLDILDIEKCRDCPVLNQPEPFAPIVTRSATMRRLLKQAELHAAGDLPILITGESGTGKELLAWAIHQASPRAEYPFTPINMASISAHLFEATFFKPPESESNGNGGAVHFLEHTHKGTLFLDEIGDLPLELQGKLLRVLQEGEYSRVGSNDRIILDLRVIAATNEDLNAMIARKAFRKDLYYRIRSGWLHLPPLRERAEDLPLLTDTFLKKYIPDAPSGKRITDQAMHVLTAHPWPGNVRELKSVLHEAASSADGGIIDVMHLPASVRDAAQRSTGRTRGSKRPYQAGVKTLAEVEKAHVLRVYRQLDKNKVRTAKALGIGLNTLRRKLTAYGAA